MAPWTPGRRPASGWSCTQGRTPVPAAARIATWTATHGVGLVATAEDFARADVAALPDEG